MKVALIGYGLAGKVFHAPHINACEGLDLKYIVSSRVDEIQSTYSNALVLKESNEIYKHEVDIVVIATPNETHFNLAIQALENDCHVIIDKPFTPSLKESQELINKAKEKQLIISSFHNRRFDGDFLTVKKLIKQRAFGEVKLFESNFNRFRPSVNKENWRETTDVAGGIFFDLGPHLLDQALNLFGSPQFVSLEKDNMRKGAQNDDYFKAHLYYDKLKVELNAHCFQATPSARFRIQGDQGGFEKFGMDPQEGKLKKNGYQEKQGEDISENFGTLYVDDESKKIPTVDGNYLAYYENFKDSIIGNAQLEVMPEDIINVQYTLDLLLDAFKEGKKLKWELK